MRRQILSLVFTLCLFAIRSSAASLAAANCSLPISGVGDSHAGDTSAACFVSVDGDGGASASASVGGNSVSAFAGAGAAFWAIADAVASTDDITETIHGPSGVSSIANLRFVVVIFDHGFPTFGSASVLGTNWNSSSGEFEIPVKFTYGVPFAIPMRASASVSSRDPGEGGEISVTATYLGYSVAVPEPSTAIALMGLAALWFLHRTRRHCSRP